MNRYGVQILLFYLFRLLGDGLELCALSSANTFSELLIDCEDSKT